MKFNLSLWILSKKTAPGRYRRGSRFQILLAAGLILLGLISGCQQAGISPDPDLSRTMLLPTASTTPPETPTPGASQVAKDLPTVTATGQVVPQTPVIITPQLNQVTDPSAGFSAWRPPVYPVPWLPSAQDHFLFSNPVAAFDIEGAFTTYGYGDVFFKDVVHTGIDIPGDIGTPILAAGSGKVVYAGSGVYRGGNDIFDDPYGNAVVIQHTIQYQGQTLYTLYAHLDKITTAEGAVVKTGDTIGLMGDTGRTTGPHLHFEVRVGDNDYFATRNPDLWISPPQGWGVLVGQILTYGGRLLEQQEVYLYPVGDTLEQQAVDHNLWIAKSYLNEAINSDSYYNENLTVSNLPAGTYYIQIPATNIGYLYRDMIEIKPGEVTFIKFNLWRGFTKGLPPTPEIPFTPAP